MSKCLPWATAQLHSREWQKTTRLITAGCSRVLEAKPPERAPQVSFCCASTPVGWADSGGVRRFGPHHLCSPLSFFLASRLHSWSRNPLASRNGTDLCDRTTRWEGVPTAWPNPVGRGQEGWVGATAKALARAWAPASPTACASARCRSAPRHLSATLFEPGGFGFGFGGQSRCDSGIKFRSPECNHSDIDGWRCGNPSRGPGAQAHGWPRASP